MLDVRFNKPFQGYILSASTGILVFLAGLSWQVIALIRTPTTSLFNQTIDQRITLVKSPSCSLSNRSIQRPSQALHLEISTLSCPNPYGGKTEVTYYQIYLSEANQTFLNFVDLEPLS